ncbi:chymotrypsin B1 [Metarhizium robertsii ARSEF 23]|uniref:Chymotrypsin B1 n=1 Tax=Metarhizium robertsii (strain ARSEF 23 / ATCC MYA-3075) TaxID=655844 RepID=E9EKA5_METRA|nr:chymotrypsin B1 [Metarhizium robertsii ARSEF 23]EFZ03846.2 chymotrypsin B1 [Metarhizium robertsii ARSEF 23]
MIPKIAITLAIAFSATLASSATIKKRVIGGEDAQDGEIRSIVSILNENSTHECGGSLLDSTTVLTAAHCINEDQILSVMAGTVDVETRGGVEAKVASFRKHPNYTRDKNNGGPWVENDIAVLKLSTPIEKSNTIDYATLPPVGSDAMVNSTAIAAGWKDADLQDRGIQAPILSLEGNFIPAKKLSKIVLTIRAREDCAKYDDGVGDRDTIICAGGIGKNLCLGDSGSPLFDQETGQLLGVMSRGIEVSGSYCYFAPDVFSRVGSYISFINENLENSVTGQAA